MPKQSVNSMYPDNIYTRASDILEKIKVPGIKIKHSPATINQPLGNGFWLDVSISQNNDNEWCFFISLSNESERMDKYAKTKVIPLSNKFKDQSYIIGIENTIKQFMESISNHKDPKMFEMKLSNPISPLINSIRGKK